MDSIFDHISITRWETASDKFRRQSMAVQEAQVRLSLTEYEASLLLGALADHMTVSSTEEAETLGVLHNLVSDQVEQVFQVGVQRAPEPRLQSGWDRPPRFADGSVPHPYGRVIPE